MIYPCPEGLTKRRHPSVCKMAVVIQILPEVDTICRSDGDRGPHRANFTAPIINTERNCVSLCYLLWSSRKHSQFRALVFEITCTAGRFFAYPEWYDGSGSWFEASSVHKPSVHHASVPYFKDFVPFGICIQIEKATLRKRSTIRLHGS